MPATDASGRTILPATDSRALPAFTATPAAYRWSQSKATWMLISEVSRA
jgi:hypothetical protein